MNMTQKNNYLNLANTAFNKKPFPHFTALEVLPVDRDLLLLEWLEKYVGWKKVTTDFYEQYEFNLRKVTIPFELMFLTDELFLDSLKTNLAKFFEVEFSKQVDVTAHKLIAGQQIGIHNDYIPSEETHRLLIQLNRDWTHEDGGMLIFYNSENIDDVYKRFFPVHNSAVGFAISENSYHAVENINKNERFTLVYSFYKIA